MKATVKPAVIEADMGIPNDVKSPICVILSKVEAIDVRINVDEASSFSTLTEIICCC